MAPLARSVSAPALAVTLLASLASAQQISPPFDQSYSWRSLGSVPGVPTPYGGITFKFDDPDVLLIGGAANSSTGAVYQIRVSRDAQGAIRGFVGQATQLATAPNIDGGLQYGPNNVLFFTQYPISGIGQIRAGSTAPDKLITLGTANGWTSNSPGALTFVPPGYAGAGELKVNSWSGAVLHTTSLTPDGSGTFDVTGFVRPTRISGGPEGLLFPPPGSPQLRDYQQMLVCEYSAAGIVVYDLDANGDPLPATRQQFMTGVSGAEGATIDAATGAFLFSTFGGGNQVLVVDGFASCGSFVGYGTSIPNGSGQTPSIRGTGCATFNRAITFQVGNGPSNAPGAMNVGFTRTAIPLFGGSVLTTPDIPIGHSLDAIGQWTTTLNTPNDPSLVGNSIFFQSAYFDLNAPFGVVASDGLEMRVR